MNPLHMLRSPDLTGSKIFPLYIKIDRWISVPGLNQVHSVDLIKEFLFKAGNFQTLNMLTNSWQKLDLLDMASAAVVLWSTWELFTKCTQFPVWIIVLYFWTHPDLVGGTKADIWGKIFFPQKVSLYLQVQCILKEKVQVIDVHMTNHGNNEHHTRHEWLVLQALIGRSGSGLWYNNTEYKCLIYLYNSNHILVSKNPKSCTKTQNPVWSQDLGKILQLGSSRVDIIYQTFWIVSLYSMYRMKHYITCC